MAEAETDRVDAGAPIPVLTSSAHDTKRTCDFLASAEIEATPCGDVDELLAAIRSRPAAMLVAEEALASELARVAAASAAQPTEPEVMALVLIAPRRATQLDRRCTDFLNAFAAALLLTRPVHPITLLSVIREAQRGRERALARARAAQALHEAVQRAARRDRAKDEFIAQLAYELRNPLAPVYNAVHVLRIQPDPPDAGHVRWASEVIGRQTQQVARFADEVRDVVLAGQRALALRREPVELGRVLAQAIENARAVTAERKLNVVYHPPPELLRVQADRARLLQIVGKVLEYSAHTTPAGGRILVAARREQETAVVTISDDGAGIEANALPEIFEPFQIVRPIEQLPALVALGLVLARRLAQLHGGTLEVHSEGREKGTVYTLRLAALPTVMADFAAPPEPRAPGETPPRWRILVVDDEPDVAQSFALLLSLMGHDVLAVNDGAAALRALATFAPQIAFVDIGLPEIDGFALAPQLRAAKPQDLRLVALTGYGQEGIATRAAAAGYDCVLLKPVAAETVEQLLAAYR